MSATRQVQKFLRNVRRTGRDIAHAARGAGRELRRSIKKSRLVKGLKELIPTPAVIIPPVEIVDGKIVFSVDQLAMLAGAYLEQENFHKVPGWTNGWSATPLVDGTSEGTDPNQGERWFGGLEFRPVTMCGTFTLE